MLTIVSPQKLRTRTDTKYAWVPHPVCPPKHDCMHRDLPCAQAKMRLTSQSFVITFGCTSFYAEQVQRQWTLYGPKLPNSRKSSYRRAKVKLTGHRQKIGWRCCWFLALGCWRCLSRGQPAIPFVRRPPCFERHQAGGRSWKRHTSCCPLLDAPLYIRTIASTGSSPNSAQSTDSKMLVGCRERSQTCLNLLFDHPSK